MEKARDLLILSDAVREDSVFVGLSGLRDQWIDIKIGFILTGPLGERVAERNSDILLALLDLARECEITTSHESLVQGQM